MMPIRGSGLPTTTTTTKIVPPWILMIPQSHLYIFDTLHRMCNTTLSQNQLWLSNNDIIFDRKNKINFTCMARVLHDSSRQIFLSWGRHKISFPLLYSFFSPSLSIHNCQYHTQNEKQNTFIIKGFIYIDVKIFIKKNIIH